MKDFKFTILPPFILLLLCILWIMTNSVGVAVLLIIFWMGWRQLAKKFNTN